MCGRYALTTSEKRILESFDLRRVPGVPLRYNIAPSQRVLAVRQARPTEDEADTGTDAGKRAEGEPSMQTASPPVREAVHLRWGLVPFWADDATIGNRMINARSESVATKPSFRHAFRHRRCLVPASGFFEWKRQGDYKQPYYFHAPEEDGVLAIAGLWETNRKAIGEGQEPIHSCTLLTTRANALMAEVHDRMPVILSPEHFQIWLDPETDDLDALQALVQPAAEDALARRPVSPLVNSPRHDTPEVLEPAESYEAGELDLGL